MVTRLDEEADVEQRVVEDPVLKQRLASSPPRTAAVRVEMWVDPGGGVPPHVHPAMEERFEVVSGQPSSWPAASGRPPARARRATLPPGVRHAYRNRGDELAHAICHATPAPSLQEFLEDAAAMARAGKMTRHGLPHVPASAASRRCGWLGATRTWS